MATLTLNIPTARVFAPLLEPAPYKGAHGGRGSGKSHYFAGAAVETCVMRPGARVVCLREIQKDLRDSAKLLIEDKIREFGAPGFEVKKPEIDTPGGGVIIFKGMRDYNADSIKSLEGFDVAWVEEAHTLTAHSLELLLPTIRKPGSEIWFSWNPHRKSDAVDALLRGDHPPPSLKLVRANWSDNPYFPEKLEELRRYHLKHSPSYRHVWEGDYATVVEGAYYASALFQAEEEGRITDIAYDPLLERRAYWDLGINDAMSIWVTQRIKQKLVFLDYIEGVGQGLDYYVEELRRRGHRDAECVLPHDGAHRSMVTGKSFSEHLKDAGFRVRVIRNGGQGAAMARVEAGRRLFPRCWFNDVPTKAGREALGAYHERRDERRSIGLGPEHDWSSHGADSFGLACLDYEEPRAAIKPEREVYRVDSGSWMG